MKVTADDIAQLLASSPPRRVPAYVMNVARSRGTSGVSVVVGVVFVLMGSLFVGIFFPTRLGDEWRLSGSGAATASGIVTAVTRTNMRINKRQVMDTTFAFTPPGGRRQTADCYTTGSRWSVGEQVTVRYLPGETAVACLEGGRLNQVGWGETLVLLFPLLGVFLIVSFVREYLGLGRVLVEGLMAEVDVRAVEPTMTKINRQTVYRITLSPLVPGGPPAVIRRRDPVEIDQFRRRAEQKQPIFALYDPRKPSRMIFPETLIDS